MWVIAGVLLGIVVVSALAGFHAGPHAHAVAAGAGILAAVVLVIMAVTGQAEPLLFVLLGVDVSLSAAVGYGAWRALSSPTAGPGSIHAGPLVHGEPWGIESAMGTALSDLNPRGIVRVRGEEWTAEAVNGAVVAGSPVQVIEVDGLVLRVWGEDVALADDAVLADDAMADSIDGVGLSRLSSDENEPTPPPASDPNPAGHLPWPAGRPAEDEVHPT